LVPSLPTSRYEIAIDMRLVRFGANHGMNLRAIS
jgi:hypothetical protein